MICRYCGSEFEPKKRGRKNTGFCSKRCADNWRKHNKYDLMPKKYTKVCGQCGMEFQTNSKNQKYCSRECGFTAKRTGRTTYVKTCLYCGHEFQTIHKDHIYCTSTCASRDAGDKRRGEYFCEYCGKPRWSDHPNRNRFCSPECATKMRVLLYLPVKEVYTKLMDGQQANLVLTDPPYNVDVEETAGKIMNDNMGDTEFYNFLLSAYRCMHANLADDGSIYVWHADTEGLNFRKAFKDAGFYLSGCCIWKKNSLVLGRSPYQWIHEPCLFGWKQKGKHQWYADRKQTTVWEYDKPRSSPDHPTMKPVNLMSYPIKNSTMTNGIVLDPFLGSGSTLIACCETDRICRGIELDPKFVDCIVKRFIAWCQDNDVTADVYVLRDGQKLRLDEVATFETEEAGNE